MVNVMNYSYFLGIIHEYELQNLIQGKGEGRETNSIQKITRFLRTGKETSITAQGSEYSRE
jgi:hypothetical protein